MQKATERTLLLEELYQETTLESRKEAIMNTFPDYLHHKGCCYFAVDNVEKAEAILNEHMNGSYFTEKSDYLSESIFFKDSGSFSCHGKFSFERPDLFMRKLIQNGVRLYDYGIESYERVYGCCC